MRWFAKPVRGKTLRGFESLPLRSEFYERRVVGEPIPLSEYIFMPEQHGTTLLTWQFPEFEVHERGTAWYFVMTLLGGGLLLSALFSGNFLFALILILLVMLFLFYHRRGPRTLTCTLTTQGVVIDNTFRPYKDIKEFRIVYDPPDVKKLYLFFASALQLSITVFIEDENPVQIREVLERYVAEDAENTDEPLSDIIARWLRL